MTISSRHNIEADIITNNPITFISLPTQKPAYYDSMRGNKKNSKNKIIQKVLIPKGTINPAETVIIEIPPSMQHTPVLLARKKVDSTVLTDKNSNYKKEYMDTKNNDKAIEVKSSLVWKVAKSQKNIDQLHKECQASFEKIQKIISSISMYDKLNTSDEEINKEDKNVSTDIITELSYKESLPEIVDESARFLKKSTLIYNRSLEKVEELVDNLNNIKLATENYCFKIGNKKYLYKKANPYHHHCIIEEELKKLLRDTQEHFGGEKVVQTICPQCQQLQGSGMLH